MQNIITDLDRRDILRYLGYRGSALPPNIDQLIEECVQETLKIITPKYRYALFDLDFGDGAIYVKGTGLVLTGKSITRNLNGCSGAYVMACTIGLEHERYLRQMMVIRPDKGVVLDSCGSVAAEAVAEYTNDQIKSLAAQNGYFCRSRFSPGYGDLPLSCQRPLLDALRADRTMGLTVGSGNLLAPNKSITAIVGICAEPSEDQHRPCDACLKRMDCEFLRRDQTCYSKRS